MWPTSAKGCWIPFLIGWPLRSFVMWPAAHSSNHQVVAVVKEVLIGRHEKSGFLFYCYIWMLRLGQHIFMLLLCYICCTVCDMQWSWCAIKKCLYGWLHKSRHQWMKGPSFMRPSVTFLSYLYFVTKIPSRLSFLLFLSWWNFERWGNSVNSFSPAIKVLGTERHAAALSFELKSFQNNNFPVSVRESYL